MRNWGELYSSTGRLSIAPKREIDLGSKRMALVLQTGDDFSLDSKMAADSSNPEMRE